MIMKSFDVVHVVTWNVELLMGVDKYTVEWTVSTSRTTGFSSAKLTVVKNNEHLDLDSEEAQVFSRTARFLRIQQLKQEYPTTTDLDKLFSGEFYHDLIMSLIDRSFEHEYVGQSCGQHLTVQDVAEFFSCSYDTMHDDLEKLSSHNESFSIINDVIVPVN